MYKVYFYIRQHPWCTASDMSVNGHIMGHDVPWVTRILGLHLGSHAWVTCILGLHHGPASWVSRHDAPQSPSLLGHPPLYPNLATHISLDTALAQPRQLLAPISWSISCGSAGVRARTHASTTMMGNSILENVLRSRHGTHSQVAGNVIECTLLIKCTLWVHLKMHVADHNIQERTSLITLSNAHCACALFYFQGHCAG